LIKRRILLFPKGNTEKEFVSAFLDNLNVKEENASENEHVCAKFVLSIRNYNEYKCFSAKRKYQKKKKKKKGKKIFLNIINQEVILI